ncbi:MAG: hypothetical protein ACYC6M_14330, partial [Terriglobales bacterium]
MVGRIDLKADAGPKQWTVGGGRLRNRLPQFSSGVAFNRQLSTAKRPGYLEPGASRAASLPF